MKENTTKTGSIGKLADVDNPFVIYCNEKNKERGKLLFRCCEGCKHQQRKKKSLPVDLPDPNK